MDSAENYFDGVPPVTLAELLRFRATHNANGRALTYISDSGQSSTLTFRQLMEQAESVALALRQLGPAGCRALLLYPAGSEFLVAFFGCSLAGWIPVPTCYPKPARPIPRLDSIAQACSPAIMLSDSSTLETASLEKWSKVTASIPRVATDVLRLGDSKKIVDSLLERPLANVDVNLQPDLALLQFTSGSTSEPKGVMVKHENILANLESIRIGFGLEFSDDRNPKEVTGVFWLPAFHDMGLIGGLLAPLYAGAHSVILSPNSFLRRPLSWLQVISEHKATVTGAPNFAYKLCVERVDGAHADGLDLSGLKVAFCGAEPIEARTLEQFARRFAHTGFRRTALFPCYGLAESTLYVTGGHFDGENAVLTIDKTDLTSGVVTIVDPRRAHSDTLSRIVCCGRPAVDTELKIVAKDTKRELPEQSIGEIWIRGTSVATGYWRSEEVGQSDEQHFTEAESSDRAFDNRLAGQCDDEPSYLHTGDLGFLYGGMLYVTGRSKDLLILRGRNHYPQDIESTVSHATGGALVQVAAVGCKVPSGEALAIVAELQRTLEESRMPEIIRQIRRAIIEQHEVDPRRIVLVRTASIPRTTSGKIQRSAVRELLEANELQVKRSWDRTDVRADGAPLPFPVVEFSSSVSNEEQIESAAKSIEAWLMTWLMIRGGVDEHELCAYQSLDQLGLDSLSAVELSGEIEDWLGLQLTPMVAFEHPTPNKLANYLARQWGEVKPSGER